jgi:hypothetical protein
MRPFCKITKEMTPAHRINLLTVALKHYAVKKEKDLGTKHTIMSFNSHEQVSRREAD